MSSLSSHVRRVSARPILWAISGSFVVLASGFVTLLHTLSPETSIPLYMLVTVLVAWRGGFRAAIPVAISATLGLDFFFTEPRFSLTMASTQDVISLTLFAFVSLLISHLSHRVQSKTKALRQAEAQQRALYDLSRSALLIDWREAVALQMCSLAEERLQLDGVAMWEAREASYVSTGDTAHAVDRLQAAYRADRNYDLPNHAESVRILRFGVRPLGAILFRGNIEPLMADAVATLIATHLERIRAVKSEVSAQSQAVSERLRTAVLDGLAHAVKTPLTTIVISSSGLREIGSLTPLQDDLAQVIEGQASYLSDLTNRLLRTAKLDSAQVLVRPRLANVRKIYDNAVEELRVAYDTGRIVAHLPAEGEIITDPDLLQMVLVQLLENALKYGADTGKVHLEIDINDGDLSLSVHNSGSYIPLKEHELVFQRYYRTEAMEHRAPGTGVGLSIAKNAVEAQGGHIWLDSDINLGTTFYITLPLAEDRNASRLSTYC
jgi:two-component system sensor histidine kinase KdpD